MPLLLGLACWTVVGGPSGGAGLPGLAVPPRAFFSLAPVGEQKRLRQFVRVCSPFYRCLQRLSMQLFEGRPIEPLDFCPGVQADLEQDLVRVDVPYTVHDLLWFMSAAFPPPLLPSKRSRKEVASRARGDPTDVKQQE
jgi:hypothetical protein